jgi:hypothetical protein
VTLSKERLGRVPPDALHPPIPPSAGPRARPFRVLPRPGNNPPELGRIVLGYLDNPSSLFWVGLVLNFLITGSFGAGLGYNTELFPTQIRGTAIGTAFTFGSAAAASSPAIVGWIAASHSIAGALPLLALSFFLLVPMFLFVARETTRKELADFVGQRT